MSEMRREVASLLLTGLLLVGCGSCNQATASPSPTGGTPPIPVSILGNGFAAQRMILAAPSLLDLLGLVHGVGSEPTFDQCNNWVQLHAPAQRGCWTDITDSRKDLFIAAQVLEACLKTKSVTARLSAGNTLTIAAVSYGQCPPGAGMVARPVLSLLAIPLAHLPADEVTISVIHSYLAGSKPFFGKLAPLKTRVDLRQPLDTHHDLQVRMAQVGSAIGAAQADALRRLAPDQWPYPRIVGTDRWTDGSLGCPTAGQTYKAEEARGFVVYLSWLGQPLDSAVEYHVAGGTVAYCGRVSY